MITTVIFAYNYREAYDYAREKDLPLPNWVFAENPDCVRGIFPTEVIELPGWHTSFQRQLAHDIVMERIRVRLPPNVIQLRPHAER